MSGDQLELCLFRRVERLAMAPGVFAGRKQPEVALGIPHNPLLTRPFHKKDCPLLSWRDHFRSGARSPKRKKRHFSDAQDIVRYPQPPLRPQPLGGTAAAG